VVADDMGKKMRVESRWMMMLMLMMLYLYIVVEEF